MDFEFKSKKELYDRVTPALRTKEEECKRLGYNNIKGVDIWNYLIINKWKDSKGLVLYDIVHDILNIECLLVLEYLKERESKNSTSNIDILRGEDDEEK